jgi:hypothetical protein
MHECLSRQELACFLALDWNERVIDIRDQVALELEETTAIAAECGWAPSGVQEQGLVPMSTDLLAVMDPALGGGQFAVAVKKAKDLNNRRVLEKLEIERRYWERRDVPWRIVTELELPKVIFQNQHFLYGYRSLEAYNVPKDADECASVVAYVFGEMVSCPLLPVARVCNAADERLGLLRGTSMVLAWHAVATKQWKVDITASITGTKPLPGLSAEAHS